MASGRANPDSRFGSTRYSPGFGRIDLQTHILDRDYMNLWIEINMAQNPTRIVDFRSGISVGFSNEFPGCFGRESGVAEGVT